MFFVFTKQILIDFSTLDNVVISLSALNESAKFYSSYGHVSGLNEIVWAIKALTLTDLTTLAGDDTESNVRRLCQRALHPFQEHELNNLSASAREKLHTAAVCVYPSRVKDAKRSLSAMKGGDRVQIAAVATGFPTGQYPLSSRLAEIRYAVEEGATEIDVVINRTLVLTGKWKELYNEIVEMRKACGDSVHLKVILAIGECCSMENVYKASMVAMHAGADFIKTSTGKEAVNATLSSGLVMVRAIEDFYKLTQRKIGFKPAGGVRTVQDAIAWISLIKLTLGDEWLQPHLFRFGASSLLDDIEKVVRNGFKELE